MSVKIKNFKHWKVLSLLILATVLLAGSIITVTVRQSYADTTIEAEYSTKKKNLLTNKTGKAVTYTIHVTGYMKKDGKTVPVDETFKNVRVKNGSTITIKAFKIVVESKDAWTIHGNKIQKYGAYRKYWATKKESDGKETMLAPVYCCDPKKHAGIYDAKDYTANTYDVNDIKSKTISWGYYYGCPQKQFSLYSELENEYNEISKMKEDVYSNMPQKEALENPNILKFLAATQVANWRRWHTYTWDDYKYYASYEKFTASSDVWSIATQILANANSNKTPPGANDPVKGEVKKISKNYKVQTDDGSGNTSNYTTSISLAKGIGSTYQTSTGWQFDSKFWISRGDDSEAARMLPAMQIEIKDNGSDEWKVMYELPMVFNNYATTKELEGVNTPVTIIINGEPKTYEGKNTYLRAYNDFKDNVVGDHSDSSDPKYENALSKHAGVAALLKTDSSGKASGGTRVRVKFEFGGVSLAKFALGINSNPNKVSGYYKSDLSTAEYKTVTDPSTGNGYKNIYAKLAQIHLKSSVIKGVVDTREAYYLTSSNLKQRYFYYRQTYNNVEVDIPLDVSAKSGSTTNLVYRNSSDLVINKYPLSSLRDHVESGATNSSLQTYDSMVRTGKRAIKLTLSGSTITGIDNVQQFSLDDSQLTSGTATDATGRSVKYTLINGEPYTNYYNYYNWGKIADYATTHSYTSVSHNLAAADGDESDTTAYTNLNLGAGLASVYDSNYLASVGSYAKIQTITGGSNTAESQYYKAFQYAKYDYVPIGVGSGMKSIVNSPTAAKPYYGKGVTSDAVAANTPYLMQELLGTSYTVDTSGPSWILPDSRMFAYSANNTIANSTYNVATTVKDTTIFKILTNAGVSRRSAQAYCKYLAKLYNLSIASFYLQFDSNNTCNVYAVQDTVTNNLLFAYNKDAINSVGADWINEPVFDFGFAKYQDKVSLDANGKVSAITEPAYGALASDLLSRKYVELYKGLTTNQNSYTVYANYKTWLSSNKDDTSARTIDTGEVITVEDVQKYMKPLDHADFSNLTNDYASEYYQNKKYNDATRNEYAERRGDYDRSYCGLGARIAADNSKITNTTGATVDNANGLSYFFDKKLWLFNSKEAKLIRELIDNNAPIDKIWNDIKITNTSNEGAFNSCSTIVKIGTQYRLYENNSKDANCVQDYATTLYNTHLIAGKEYDVDSLSVSKIKYCLLAAAHLRFEGGIGGIDFSTGKIEACSQALKSYVCTNTSSVAISGTNNATATKVVDALFHMSQISRDAAVDNYHPKKDYGEGGKFTKAGINETVGTRIPSSIISFFKARFATDGEYSKKLGMLSLAPDFVNNCERDTGGVKVYSAPINGLIWKFGYDANQSDADYEYSTVSPSSLCYGYSKYQFYSLLDELQKQSGTTLASYSWGCYDPETWHDGNYSANTGNEYVGSRFTITELCTLFDAYAAKSDNSGKDKAQLIDSFLENCTSNIYYSVIKQALESIYTKSTVNATYRIYPINVDALQLIQSVNMHTGDGGVSDPTTAFWVNREGEQCMGFSHSATNWTPTTFYTDDQSTHYTAEADNAGSGYIGSNSDEDSTIYDYRADEWYAETKAWFKAAFDADGSDGATKVNTLINQMAAAGYEKTDEKINVLSTDRHVFGSDTEGDNYRFVTGYKDRDTADFMETVTNSKTDDPEDSMYFTVSTTKGSLSLDNLPAGDYYIVEVGCDNGYTTADSRVFTSQLHEDAVYSKNNNPYVSSSGDGDGVSLDETTNLTDIGTTTQKYAYQVDLTNLDVNNASDGTNISDHFTRGFVYSAVATKGLYGEEGSLKYKIGYDTGSSNTIGTNADGLVTINDDNDNGNVSDTEDSRAAISDYWRYKSGYAITDDQDVSGNNDTTNPSAPFLGLNDAKYVRARIIYWFNGYNSVNQFNKFGVAYGGVRKQDVDANVDANASYYTTYTDDDDPTTLNKASSEGASESDTGISYKETGTKKFYDENAGKLNNSTGAMPDALAASYKLGDKEIQPESAGEQDDVENAALTGLHRNTEITNQSLSGIYNNALGIPANTIVKIFTTSSDAEFYCKSVALAKNLKQDKDDNSYIGSISDFAQLTNLEPGSYTIMELQSGYKYQNGVVIPEVDTVAGDDNRSEDPAVTAKVGYDVKNVSGNTGEWMIKPYVNKFNELFAITGQWWRNWKSPAFYKFEEGYYSDKKTNTASVIQAMKEGAITENTFDWRNNVTAEKKNNLSSVFGVVPTLVEASSTIDNVLVDTDEEAWAEALATNGIPTSVNYNEELVEMFSASNIKGYTSSPWVKVGTFEIGNYTQTKVGNSNLLNISNEVLPSITLVKLDQNDYDVIKGTVADDGSTTDGVYSYNVADIKARAKTTAGYLNSADDDANYNSETGMKFVADNWKSVSDTANTANSISTGYSKIYSYVVSDTAGNGEEKNWLPNNVYLTKFRLTSVSQAEDGTWYADGVGTDVDGVEVWSNGQEGSVVYDTDGDGIVDNGCTPVDSDGDGVIDSSDISSILGNGYARITGVHPGYYTVEEIECYDTSGRSVPVTTAKLTKYVGIRYTGYANGYATAADADKKYEVGREFDLENIFVVENSTDEYGKYKVRKLDENGNPVQGVTFSLSKLLDYHHVEDIPSNTDYCTPNDFNANHELYKNYTILDRAYYDVQTTDEDGYATFVKIPYDVLIDKFGNFETTSEVNIHLEEIDHGDTGTIPVTKLDDGTLKGWTDSADGCQICNARKEDTVAVQSGKPLYNKVFEKANIDASGQYTDESLLDRWGYNDTLQKITGSDVNNTLDLSKVNTVIDTKSPKGKFFTIAKKKAVGSDTLLSTPMGTKVRLYLDTLDAEEDSLYVYKCINSSEATSEKIARVAGNYYLARPGKYDSGEFIAGLNPAENEFSGDTDFELVTALKEAGNPSAGVEALPISELIGEQVIYLTENWNDTSTIYVSEEDDSALAAVKSGELSFNSDGVLKDGSGTTLNKVNSIAPRKYKVSLEYKDAKTYNVNYTFNVSDVTVGSDAPTTYKDGKDFIVSRDQFTKDGQYLEGWYTDQTYTEKVTDMSSVTKNNTTIYLYGKFVTGTATSNSLRIKCVDADSTTGTDTVTFFNKGKVSISIHKLNNKSQSLAGVTFYVIPKDVYDANHDVVNKLGKLKFGTDEAEEKGIITLVTNASGFATTGDVLSRGSSYVIMEGPAPKGYLRNDGVIATFTRTEDNCVESECSFDLSERCGHLDEDVLTTNSVTVIDDVVNVEFYKEDENGNGLNNAEFTLKCTSNPSIVIPSAVSATKNGKDGYVQFKDIPVADYELYETKSPAGFVKKDGVLATVTADELLAALNGNSVASKTYRLNDQDNTPIKGRIRLIKKSSDDAFLAEHALDGAEFRVVTLSDWNKYGRKAANAKDFDGNVVRDLVSDEEGITGYTPYLKQGSYVVFETKAPKYMEVNYDWYQEFTIDSSWVTLKDGTVKYSSKEYSCTDKPYKTRVKVFKYDAMRDAAGQPLAGAEFTLYTYDGETGEDEYTLPESAQVVGTALTGDDGYATFNDIYLDGKHYCLRETKAPSGYWLGTTEGNSAKSRVYYLDDKYFKTDTAVTVSNEVSTINYPPTISVGDLAQLKLRINKHTVSGRKVAGAGFTIYKVADEEDEGAVEIKYKNGKKKPDGSYVTDGATQTGYGIPVSFTYTTDTNIGEVKTASEFFTDSDGRIDFPGYLELGDYYVVETTTPNGFVTADTVRLTIDGDTSYTLDNYGKYVIYDVTELRVGFVKVHKTDDAGVDLEGITFVLTGADGTNYEAITDADGICTWGYTDTNGDGVPDGLPLGDYTLSEGTIPDKYKGLLKISDKAFTLTEDNNTYEAPYLLEEVDIYNTSLKVYKLDSETNKPLAGAEFTLYDGNGRIIDTKVSDTNGLVVFSKVLEYDKTYTVKETKAPEGYELNSETQTVSYTQNELDEYPQEEIEKRHTLTFYNTKKRAPKFILHKVTKDANTSTFTALSGAKIGLYDSDHKLVSEQITDSDGNATWEELKSNSTYYYRELEAPEGYSLDSTEYMFTTSDASGECVERTLINTEIKRSLVIIKKDNNSNKPLAGAKFNLYDTDVTGMDSDEIIKHLVKTGTTDSNGVLAFSSLKANTVYYYQEIEAPSGYCLDDKVYKFEDQSSAIKNSKDNTEIELKAKDLVAQGYEVTIVTNTIRYVRFTKYDMEGNVIERVGCTIAIYDKDGKEVTRGTTDASGTITFTNLDAGDYTYKEITAPNGYKLNKETFSFSIKGSDKEILISMQDEATPHGDFDFTKVDIDNTSVLIPNCKIVIRDAKGKEVATGITDANGKYSLSNLEPGKYTYQEIEAPKGYEIDSTPYEFEISENKVTHCTMKDVKQGSFEFTKTDIDDETILIPNCEILIRDANGNEVVRGVTDKNGKYTLTLPSGTYTYQEITAPEGYLLDNGVYKFTVTAGKVTHCVMKDIKTGGMEFTKTDIADDTKLIPGCQIVIKNEKGEDVVKGTTDKTGKIVFNNLAPGKYTYQEIKAPKGYKIDTKPYEFEVKSGKITKCVMKDVLGTGKGKITKTDINTGEKVPNCGILITDKNGKEMFRGYTDKNGNVEFENFPVGTYYYSEFDAPEGWLLNEKVYSFTIKEDGDIIKCKMKDVKEGSKQGIFDVLKVDADDNTKVLSGATFKVYDKNKKLVATKVTGSDGIAEFALPLGTYYVKETEAPDGYILDSKLHKFKISTEGEYLQYEMENTKIKPKPTKTIHLPKTGTVLKIGAIILSILLLLGGSAFLFSTVYFIFRKRRR